jgi:UDP-N-acetylmuramyl pentapeptide phosphotransferase/UDP-N-acetylglucosamine-1-phosphate transferase
LRGFLIGLILVPVLVITLLSIRPGGLRNQLRNVARRLKLALILGGIYILISAALRLLLPGKAAADYITVAVALVLTVIFIFLGQDRQLER